MNEFSSPCFNVSRRALKPLSFAILINKNSETYMIHFLTSYWFSVVKKLQKHDAEDSFVRRARNQFSKMPLFNKFSQKDSLLENMSP